MYLEIPFIPGILILLIISIVFAKLYREIANFIGEQIRAFFLKLWKAIKR